MSEWKEYNGSDEQIAEMENAKDGFIYRNAEGIEFSKESDVSGLIHMSEYLICNTHPLANMICQQARTGQQVWIRETSLPCLTFGKNKINTTTKVYETTTPNWNIPNAEYSFTKIEV